MMLEDLVMEEKRHQLTRYKQNMFQLFRRSVFVELNRRFFGLMVKISIWIWGDQL
jgi:hypothetical protein